MIEKNFQFLPLNLSDHTKIKFLKWIPVVGKEIIWL